MKKEDLRPVVFSYKDFSKAEDPLAYPEIVEKKGFFHKWEKTTFESGSESYSAIIEDEDGNIHTVEKIEFRFSDR